MITMRKIFLLLISTSIATFYSCTSGEKDIHPVRKDIVQAVYASGKIFPQRHYTVVSKFPGYIQKIHVNAGDQVKHGQLLLTIKNETGQLSTSSARNQYELARQNASEDGS